MKLAISAVLAIGLVAGAGTGVRAATEIQWWHAMAGANNEVVEAIAQAFNDSQGDYRVVPVFKGTYPETLEAGMAAFHAGQSPNILQVFDVGTGVMMAAQGAIVPVAEVMERGGVKFDKSQYLPGIVAYYSKPDGTMLSFPFNSSSPITFYNKDILQRAGLDPDAQLKTWPDVWSAARKIVNSGAAPCGYTSAWPIWIHVENFAAWNNLPYATKQNGLGGADVQLLVDTPIFVKHFQEIADLARDDVFRYGGRAQEAKQLFLAGECAIFNDSSAALADLMKSGINFGTGPLPYEPSAPGAPQNTIPGGASLWVFAGHTEDEYKGVAGFFKFLSQTDVQVRLHQMSGYLPATMSAYEATKKSGFYEKNPGREQPILQMMGKTPTENSRGVRLVDLPEVRDIMSEEFEAMLNGQESAQEALRKAVRRGNAAIRQALGN